MFDHAAHVLFGSSYASNFCSVHSEMKINWRQTKSLRAGKIHSLRKQYHKKRGGQAHCVRLCAQAASLLGLRCRGSTPTDCGVLTFGLRLLLADGWYVLFGALCLSGVHLLQRLVRLGSSGLLLELIQLRLNGRLPLLLGLNILVGHYLHLG